MGKETILIRKLRLFKENAEKEISIDRLIFFGSRAKGKVHRWSDVDLIVVSGRFRRMNFFERGAKMYDYWNIKLPVDFLCFTPEEFEKKAKGVTIVSEALREGIEI